MSKPTLDESLLVECLTSPWSSAFQLAMRSGATHEAAQAACERLTHAGYLQCIHSRLSHLPPILYAPTASAIEIISERWQISPSVVARNAYLYQERFWWLRAALDIAQEANGLCSTLAFAKPEWRVAWEIGIVRTYRSIPLILHGRFSVHVPLPAGGEKGGVFYLLVDQGRQKAVGWWRILRYLSAMSRRDAKQKGVLFPPILIVTTNAFRAASLMCLAHKFNCRALLTASWDRGTIFSKGAHAADWFSLGRSETNRLHLQQVHPFSPDQLHPCAQKHHPRGMSRSNSTSASKLPLPDLQHTPEKLKALPALESLDDRHMAVLVFLCKHPLCPRSTIEAFLCLTHNEANAILHRLSELGLATQEEVLLPVDRSVFGDDASDTCSRRTKLIREYAQCHAASTERRMAEAMRQGVPIKETQLAHNTSRQGMAQLVLPLSQFWQASSDAVRLCALREGRDEVKHVNAHASLCRERHARPYHALAVYDFFERLKDDCVRYAAATRKLVGVNVAYYELITFEDELFARTVFLLDGKRSYWCPDGYGVIRCGRHCTPFWLEIDGTLQTRSRLDVRVWQQKLGALCAYFQSGDWTRRHPEFPALLIVTKDMSIKGMLKEVLERASNGHGISTPDVFLTSRAVLLQRGPLAPVWSSLNAVNISSQLTYAFAGAKQPGIVNGAAKMINNG